MIPVIRVDEPKDFDVLVRVPGNAFLDGLKRMPTQREWEKHDYWVRSLEDLYIGYGRVCSYCCLWIPRITGSRNVEHFVAKSVETKQAYEWENYRLVCGTINGRKSKFDDVADPFEVVPGMFVIEFPSLLIRVGDRITEAQKSLAHSTIRRLKLNDDPATVEARKEWLEAYVEGDIPFDFLSRKAPFLAAELERQGLVTRIRTMMTVT